MLLSRYAHTAQSVTVLRRRRRRRRRLSRQMGRERGETAIHGVDPFMGILFESSRGGIVFLGGVWVGCPGEDAGGVGVVE